MSLKRVWIPSPNYNAGNSGRRLLVLHTSEGAQTYQSLGNFFSNPSSQVSSHVGIDDTLGTIGEYVKRGNTAWTAAGANIVAVQAEFCTPSGAADGWTTSIWKNNHHNMLQNAADWLREESQATGIPLVKLTPGQAQGSGRGVCQHSDLGAWGGGHHDCGPGFPIDYVLSLAKGGSPEPSPEDDDVAGSAQITNPTSGNLEVWEVNKAGELWSHTWRPSNNQWDQPTKRGTGYYGVPSASIDKDGNIRVVALTSGACVCWTLPPTGGWSKANV